MSELAALVQQLARETVGLRPGHALDHLRQSLRRHPPHERALLARQALLARDRLAERERRERLLDAERTRQREAAQR